MPKKIKTLDTPHPLGGFANAVSAAYKALKGKLGKGKPGEIDSYTLAKAIEQVARTDPHRAELMRTVSEQVDASISPPPARIGNWDIPKEHDPTWKDRIRTQQGGTGVTIGGGTSPTRPRPLVQDRKVRSPSTPPGEDPESH